MTKDEVIAAVNARLRLTGIGPEPIQIPKNEHDAPLLHALIAVLLEVVNSKEDRRS